MEFFKNCNDSKMILVKFLCTVELNISNSDP